MADTRLNIFTIGQGRHVPTDHYGPKSYTTGGETLGETNNFTGNTSVGLSTIDNVLGSGSLSISGNYWVVVQPTGTGERKTFKLLWFTASSGVPSFTQVTAATDLSAEVVRLDFIGR